MKCEGCLEEMQECYEWQSKGFDAGLYEYEGHLFVFVLDERGKFIIW